MSNDEFYVGLKPYSDRSWSGAIHTKPQLIEAIQKKLSAFPGIIFNYTQPAEDAVDEAETGLKSALAVKILGGDLKVLDEKAARVKSILQKVKGITEITVVRELGQPSLTITPDRDKLARCGLNVDDVNTMVETAMGGKAVAQVIQGERQFDLVVRMQPQFRSDENAIKNLLISTADGQNLPLSQFADIHEESGASFIYRESNSRYLGVQFSVEGRDLAGYAGGVPSAASADYDDRAGSVFRIAAGGHVDRYRQRLTEAVRHRDRWRPGFKALALHLFGAGAVRAGRKRWRHPAGVASAPAGEITVRQLRRTYDALRSGGRGGVPVGGQRQCTESVHLGGAARPV